MNQKRMAVPAVVLGSLLLQGGARAHVPDTTAEIAKFETEFSSALEHNAVQELKHFLSADWKIVSGDGSVIDRERFLAVIAGGDLKHTSMSSDKPAVRRYGNAALVTSHLQSAGTYKGTAFETNEIGTDFIVKIHGRWVCVLTQLTTIAKR